MRKENNAIKKRLTMQIQDLRRQIVTKQAFDKGELMQEIQRTKKELAFANKQLYNKRVQKEGAGPSQSTQGNPQAFSNELENSMKLVETISNQKKMLETENEELKSKISDMLNQRTNDLAQNFEQIATTNSAAGSRPGIPLLNFSSQGVM